MHRWIALFRGINVGGRNKMPMAKLRTTLEFAGFRSVRTYIQTGNVVFNSSVKSERNLNKRIGDAIQSEFGFLPGVLLLTERDFTAAIKNNPFSDAQSDPKFVHFFFLDAAPESPDVDGINSIANSSERHKLILLLEHVPPPAGTGAFLWSPRRPTVGVVDLPRCGRARNRVVFGVPGGDPVRLLGI